MKDITKPELATSEGEEHTFGMLRTIVREFNTMQFIQLIEKKTRRLNLIFRNGFSTSRDPQKGYAATFTKFIDLSRDEIPPVMDGTVEINRDGSPVVEQLWDMVSNAMAFASSPVVPILKNVGVTSEERSPFCLTFSNQTDLREEFIAYLPKQFSFGKTNGNADAYNTDAGACDAPIALPEAIVFGRVKSFANEMQTNGERDDEDNDDYNVEDVSPSQIPHPTATPPAELMTTLLGLMSSSMDDLLKNAVDASSCLECKEKGSLR